MQPEKTVEIRDMREPRLAMQKILEDLRDVADAYYQSNAATEIERVRAEFIGHRIMDCRLDLDRLSKSIDAEIPPEGACSIRKSPDNGS